MLITVIISHPLKKKKKKNVTVIHDREEAYLFPRLRRKSPSWWLWQELNTFYSHEDRFTHSKKQVYFLEESNNSNFPNHFFRFFCSHWDLAFMHKRQKSQIFTSKEMKQPMQGDPNKIKGLLIVNKASNPPISRESMVSKSTVKNTLDYKPFKKQSIKWFSS